MNRKGIWLGLGLVVVVGVGVITSFALPHGTEGLTSDGTALIQMNRSEAGRQTDRSQANGERRSVITTTPTATLNPTSTLTANSAAGELPVKIDSHKPETHITPLTYTVQAGDTLTGIGQWFGLDYFTLAAANNLTDTDRLRIGQQLLIPGVDLTGQVLGLSTLGWPIQVYRIGNGPQGVILVGGIHGGYEWNTIALAYAAIGHFSRHPDQVPDSISLYIIPAANPDGQIAIVGHPGRFSPAEIATDTVKAALPGRFNGNGVDLNRNWACDWLPTARWQAEEINPGSAPFSEVETRLLRDFLTRPNTEAVVFWHSAFPGVFAGACGAPFPPAETLATVYAQAAGYPRPGDFQPYDLTGETTNWLASRGIPAITVELTSHTGLDWPQNLAGVQAIMLNLNRK